jgi:PII-like signaling protein
MAVSDECAKLTAYFGERDRIEGQLVADRLLDLYEQREIQMSVLLRGAQGFGPARHLRTDRLLTLSEDLPVVSVAVDTRERIEGLLERVHAIQRRGLLTLERARMLAGTVAPHGGLRAEAADAAHLATPEETVTGPHRDDATEPEQTTKLTVYLGRHERAMRRPAFAAVCALLHAEGIAGASTLLGVDGARRGQRRRARFFAANSDVPMMIVAVGSTRRIEGVLPRLGELLDDPLLTLERVKVCKRDGELIEAPHEPTAADGRWQKLTVVSSEGAMHGGQAVHLQLIRRLRGAGAAGATSLRGIWGFHGEHAPHGDKLLSLRRHVPMLTVLIDTPEKIARLFPIVDELTGERGLVTSELVPSIVTASRGCSSVG